MDFEIITNNILRLEQYYQLKRIGFSREERKIKFI